MSGGRSGSAAAHVGDIAIVLHTHMPYVEGYGTYPFGEEWLFDAVIRSYLPVLGVVEGLTMTITPVLADQLEAEGVAERLIEFTRHFRVGSARLDAEQMREQSLRAACLAEGELYGSVLAELERHGGDALTPFIEAAAAGRIELMASSASHAILPLLATTAGRRLQVETGLGSHRRRFGPVRGFWLPECAYDPGLEHLLAAGGIEYFCVDQSRHQPPAAALQPVSTRGLTAFPIDW